jgi:hypothetical protein
MTNENIPNILQCPADFGGCGFWRILWPQIVMNMKGIAKVSHLSFVNRDFLHYNYIKALHVQRQVTDYQLDFYKKLVHLKKRMSFKLVYESDDIIFAEDIPDYNPAKEKIMNIGNCAKDIMELCDEVTVSTPFLRDYYLKKTSQKKITVIPNAPPLFWIGNYYDEEELLKNYRAHRKKPRIIYAGSAGHFHYSKEGKSIPDDFTHVKEAVMSNADRYRWVFVGGFPTSLLQEVKAGLIEYHPWQSIDKYPKFLSMLEGNMWVAPLQENDFNRAKSDLKFLEASALGLPIACQDMSTFAVAPIRFKTGEEMIKRLDETLESEETFLKASRKARSLVENRWLERDENIGKYLDVYCRPFGDPMRKYV